jgi:hypothetical protein
MGMACCILLKSLDPGNNEKYAQYSIFWHASVEGGKPAVVKGDTTTASYSRAAAVVEQLNQTLGIIHTEFSKIFGVYHQIFGPMHCYTPCTSRIGCVGIMVRSLLYSSFWFDTLLHDVYLKNWL